MLGLMRRSKFACVAVDLDVDGELIMYSYIVPGLGDFGDRFYTM